MLWEAGWKETQDSGRDQTERFFLESLMSLFSDKFERALLIVSVIA